MTASAPDFSWFSCSRVALLGFFCVFFFGAPDGGFGLSCGFGCDLGLGGGGYGLAMVNLEARERTRQGVIPFSSEVASGKVSVFSTQQTDSLQKKLETSTVDCR